jgi:hypothetical protein
LAATEAGYDAVAGLSGRAWAAGPIPWDPRLDESWQVKAVVEENKAAIVHIASEKDRKDLARIANAVYADKPSKVSNLEEHTQCEDEWAAVIRNYAYGRDRVYVDDVGRHVLNKFKLGSFGKNEQLRIGKIFVAMGWEHWRDRMGRGFVNPTVIVFLNE